MPIDKKFIRFREKSNFLSQENGVNNNYETPSDSEGNVAVYGNLKGNSIVFIEDSKEIWTHGNLYKSVNWSVLGKVSKTIIVPTSLLKDVDNLVMFFLDTDAIPENYFVRLDSVDIVKVRYADSNNLINENTVLCLIVKDVATIGGVTIPLSNSDIPFDIDYENNELIFHGTNYDDDGYLPITFCLGYLNADDSVNLQNTELYIK